MNTPIHIVLAFDDNFWAPAFTVMRSACLATHRRKDLVFHLLHMPISAAHRYDLEGIVREFGASLRWYPVAESALFDFFTAELPITARWPKIVYARMLVADLLPTDINRAIYLDCDMLVRAPIERLFETDLGGQPVGAVQDAFHPFATGKRDMREGAGTFDTADPCFNSGMMVIDLPKWREIDVKSEVAAIAGKGWIDKRHYDQDILNLVFRNRWQPLSWRWNTINARRAHESLNPFILHYSQEPKPWGLAASVMQEAAYSRWYRQVMTNDLFHRFARHRWARWWRRKLRLAR